MVIDLRPKDTKVELKGVIDFICVDGQSVTVDVDILRSVAEATRDLSRHYNLISVIRAMRMVHSPLLGLKNCKDIVEYVLLNRREF